MRGFPTVLGAAILVATTLWLPGSALAANVKDVLQACDNMANSQPGSCGYSINKNNGDISGCSQNACFFCPADGSRQCVGVTSARNGRVGRKVEGDVVEMMTRPQTTAPDTRDHRRPNQPMTPDARPGTPETPRGNR